MTLCKKVEHTLCCKQMQAVKFKFLGNNVLQKKNTSNQHGPKKFSPDKQQIKT